MMLLRSRVDYLKIFDEGRFKSLQGSRQMCQPCWCWQADVKSSALRSVAALIHTFSFLSLVLGVSVWGFWREPTCSNHKILSLWCDFEFHAPQRWNLFALPLTHPLLGLQECFLHFSVLQPVSRWHTETRFKPSSLFFWRCFPARSSRSGWNETEAEPRDSDPAANQRFISHPSSLLPSGDSHVWRSAMMGFFCIRPVCEGVYSQTITAALF